MVLKKKAAVKRKSAPVRRKAKPVQNLNRLAYLLLSLSLSTALLSGSVGYYSYRQLNAQIEETSQLKVRQALITDVLQQVIDYIKKRDDLKNLTKKRRVFSEEL